MKNKSPKNNIINFPASVLESEREIEAILFAAEEPLDVESIESKIKKKSLAVAGLFFCLKILPVTYIT